MQLKKIPDYLFIENVVNFEQSECRRQLLHACRHLGYHINEFILSPLQIGIPNDRRRYYMTAKRNLGISTNESSFHEQILYSLTRNQPHSPVEIYPLSNYLDPNPDNFDELKVPASYITNRYRFRYDIVQSNDTRSACFTKAYGSSHVMGSGSLIQTQGFERIVDFHNADTLLDIGLRFFSPLEVARLHAFPIDTKDFEFPPELTVQQQWRLLGNSLNVEVVSQLMKTYLFDRKP